MKRFLIFLFPIFLASCASRDGLVNDPQVVKEPAGYTSPNQKIEVEILIERTEKSSPESSVLRGAFKPGSIVAQHVQEDSDEYITFVRGAGEMTIGEETYFVKDGDSFFIPKGIRRSYVNRSAKDATFYQIYTPGGPEQRFKKWSKLKGL